MGFDTNAFVMDLIQQLGQQTQQAAQRQKEMSFLNQFQNQLSQASTPQEQLDLVLSGYLSGNAPKGAQERIGNVIPFVGQQAKFEQDKSLKQKEQEAKLGLESQQRDSLINFIEANSDFKKENLSNMPIKTLSDLAGRVTQGQKEQDVITYRENKKFVDDLFNKKDINNRFLTQSAINQARSSSKDPIGKFTAVMGENYPKFKGSQQALLDASMVQLLEPFTKIFPGVLSREKFKFISNRVAQAGQNPETINAFLDFVERLSSSVDLLPQAFNELQTENQNILAEPYLQMMVANRAQNLFEEVNQNVDNFINQLETGEFKRGKIEKTEKRQPLVEIFK